MMGRTKQCRGCELTSGGARGIKVGEARSRRCGSRLRARQVGDDSAGVNETGREIGI